MKLIRWGEDKRSFFVESNIEKMLLDTGATTSQITLNEKTNTFNVLSEDISHGAFGSKLQKKVEIPELIVGTHRVENIPATLDDVHGIIGMDFLKGTCIHLDLANDEFTFGEHFTDGMDLFLGEKGHIYMQCNLGDVVLWALFDTGASGTVVNQAFIDEHPEFFVKQGMDNAKDWTGAEQAAQLIRIRNMSIASNLFDEHEAGVLDLSNAKQYLEKPIDIILGATTMELAIWDFDFTNKKWKLKLNS